MASTVSVILCCLNEAADILPCLQHVHGLGADELILVDGGSTDNTLEIAQTFPHQVHLLNGHTGRAQQLNAGARRATGDVLLFTHIDMRFPLDAIQRIRAAIDEGAIGGGFRKRYQPAPRLLQLYGWLLNHVYLQWGSRLVATNGIFVRRDAFVDLGGFPEQPILEDVIFAKRLRQHGHIAVLRAAVQVSSRRYQASGMWRQVWRNARVLGGYYLLNEDFGRLRARYEGESFHG